MKLNPIQLSLLFFIFIGNGFVYAQGQIGSSSSGRGVFSLSFQPYTPEKINLQHDEMIVQGKSGYFQKSSFQYLHCDTNTHGEILYQTCDESLSSGKLNQPVKVEDGIIYINYHSSINFYKKIAGDPLVINLSHFLFKSHDRIHSMTLGRDLNNLEERIKRFKEVTSIYAPYVYRFCIVNQPFVSYPDHFLFCDKLKISMNKVERDPQDVYESLYTLSADGFESSLGLPPAFQWPYLHKVETQFENNFDTIALLPGYYTIEVKKSSGDQGTVINNFHVGVVENSFVRPILEEDRTFALNAAAEGSWIITNNIHDHKDIKFFIFDSISKTCPVSKSSIQEKVQELFRGSNGNYFYWENLNKIIDQYYELIAGKPIYVTIDNFGDQAKLYKSYHLKNTPQDGDSLISLDCRSFEDESWKFHLAHELVHAIFANLDTPIWLEEILAQTAEFMGDDRWPEELIDTLKNKSTLPSPLSTQRPFPTNETYAINFLFGQYLIKNWGFENTMTALNPFFTISECPRSSTFTLDELTCRLYSRYSRDKTAPRNLSEYISTKVIRDFEKVILQNKNNLNKKMNGKYGVYLKPNN